MNEVGTPEGVSVLHCADPGAGARLDAAARDELAARIRHWRRNPPGAVLIEVQADAWHHAPGLSVEDTGPAAWERQEVTSGYQSLVGGLFGLNCPVVVSLAGRVSGFGLALALAADVRLAAAGTVLSLGGSPVAALLGGVGWLVSRAADGGTFSQLAWGGARFSAAEAAGRGLVTRVGDVGGDARVFVEGLAVDAVGWSGVKRASVSRARVELASVLEYESWLVGVAAEECGRTST